MDQSPLAKETKRKAAEDRSSAKRQISLRDQAYEAIKQQIIRCELRPGEVLSEAILSDTLGFGRTPIHQAIARLTSDGLVEVMPRKGIMAKPVSLDEMLNIIEVRRINETHSARRAAERAEGSDVRLLEENLDAMWAAAREREITRIMSLDGEFHALLCLPTRNSVLIELLANLQDRSARLWFISLRANEQHLRVCEQHAAIVDAVRRHDPDGAEAAMRHHIDAFLDNVTKQL